MFVVWVHAIAAGERGRPLRRYMAMIEGANASVRRWQAIERMRAHI